MNNKIIIINGPNINLLGEREQSQYGSTTFEKLKENCHQKSKDLELVSKPVIFFEILFFLIDLHNEAPIMPRPTISILLYFITIKQLHMFNKNIIIMGSS